MKKFLIPLMLLVSSPSYAFDYYLRHYSDLTFHELMQKNVLNLASLESELTELYPFQLRLYGEATYSLANIIANRCDDSADAVINDMLLADALGQKLTCADKVSKLTQFMDTVIKENKSMTLNDYYKLTLFEFSTLPEYNQKEANYLTGEEIRREVQRSGNVGIAQKWSYVSEEMRRFLPNCSNYNETKENLKTKDQERIEEACNLTYKQVFDSSK